MTALETAADDGLEGVVSAVRAGAAAAGRSLSTGTMSSPDLHHGFAIR